MAVQDGGAGIDLSRESILLKNCNVDGATTQCPESNELKQIRYL